MQASAKPLKLLVFDDGCSYRQQFEKVLATWGKTNYQVVELNTLEGILNAVEADSGVTLLPVARLARHYPYKSVRVFALPAALSEVLTVFIRRKDALLSEAYSEFLQLMTNGYRFS